MHYHKTRIVWDFDDNIVENRELSIKSFNFFAKISSNIIVSTPILMNLIPSELRHKCYILSTSDIASLKYNPIADYSTKRETLNSEIKVIWVGTSSGYKSVEKFIDSISKIFDKYSAFFNNRIISFTFISENLKKDQILFNGKLIIRNLIWERNLALKKMRESHIGVMPLIDSKFNQGKGSFKIIQYFSNYLPVLASKVGNNQNVVKDGVNGFFLENNFEDFYDKLLILTSNWNEYKKFSTNSRDDYNKLYSALSNIKSLENIIYGK